jgi:hypothetical protein
MRDHGGDEGLKGRFFAAPNVSPPSCAVGKKGKKKKKTYRAESLCLVMAE